MSGGEFVREGERETDLKLLVEVGCDPDDTQCALLRENLGGIEHVRRRRAGEGGTRGGRSVSLGGEGAGAAKIKVATWRERSGTSDNVQGYESPPSIGVAVTVFGCGGSWEDVRGTSGVPLPPCPGRRVVRPTCCGGSPRATWKFSTTHEDEASVTGQS